MNAFTCGGLSIFFIYKCKQKKPKPVSKQKSKYFLESFTNYITRGKVGNSIAFSYEDYLVQLYKSARGRYKIKVIYALFD